MLSRNSADIKIINDHLAEMCRASIKIMLLEIVTKDCFETVEDIRATSTRRACAYMMTDRN